LLGPGDPALHNGCQSYSAGVRVPARMVLLLGPLALLAAACSGADSETAGPAAATPAVEATIRLAERLTDHIASAAPSAYTDVPTLTIEAFGGAAALAAAGDPDRAKPFETAAALTADELKEAVVAGMSMDLLDADKARIVDETSTTVYDVEALPTALEGLVAAILTADPSARAALSSVDDVARAITAQIVDGLRARVGS